MRTFTRTFPPGSNANYGGILQAWALQQVVQDLGHESTVDETRSSAPGVARRVLVGIVRGILEHLVPSRLVPQRSVLGIVKRAANRELLGFASQHMNTAPLYRGNKRVSRKLLAETGAYIVGSDQVWRSSYVDVPSYLLDFLPPSSKARKIAYGASFGTEHGREYTDDLILETRRLAQRFDAVSVREESAVDLCSEMWGVSATRVIDPTMLLEKERYLELVGASPRRMNGTLACYILDMDAHKQTAIDGVAAQLGLSEYSLFPEVAASISEFKRSPQRFMRPTVQKWLRSIAESEAVVTDSYHGMLFAIIFNRPFLVSINTKRGATRFDTVLEIFGLEDRKMSHDSGDVARLMEPINWEYVNIRLGYERQRGINFLRDALG